MLLFKGTKVSQMNFLINIASLKCKSKLGLLFFSYLESGAMSSSRLRLLLFCSFILNVQAAAI